MFKCQICENVEYKSRMGLYNHRMKFHPPEPKVKHYDCIYCKKEFTHKQNKWRHQQTCKKRNIEEDFNQMKNEIAQLKQEIKALKTKPNMSKTINNTTNINGDTINNTNNTNNTINNITVVIPFGKEPINCIPEAEVIKKLEECGINAIVELCKTKHFNPNKPELHNFCVTAKNDPYAIIVDSETKRPKSVNKKEVFDKAYFGVVMNIESVKSQKPEVIETKDRIKAVSMSKNMLKHVRTAINEEAYHNKDMVQTTWKNASFEDKKQVKPITKPKTRNELINELDDFLTEVKGELDIEV